MIRLNSWYPMKREPLDTYPDGRMLAIAR